MEPIRSVNIGVLVFFKSICLKKYYCNKNKKGKILNQKLNVSIKQRAKGNGSPH